MEPNRATSQGSITWISVFHALLFKAKSLVYSILSSHLLLSLSMSTSVLPYLSFHYYGTLGSHYALVPLEIFIGHVQTIFICVGQAFFNRCYPYPITYIILPDLIHSCMATNPKQHTHVHNTYLLYISSIVDQLYAPYNIADLIVVPPKTCLLAFAVPSSTRMSNA